MKLEEGNSRLPSFRTPPVSEVVLAVAFKPLRSLQTAKLLELWQSHFRAEFPTVEENAPYDPPVELLDRPPSGPTLRFGIGDARLSPRLWFLNQDGTVLLQAQSDWFAVNWRRMSPADTYDRYPAVREVFQRRLTELAEFVEEQGLGELVPQQCEVTYVNQIERSGVWETHGDLAKAVVLAGEVSGSFLAELESARIVATAVIREDDQPVARLHISANPAFKPAENEPVIILNLTARGEPKTPDLPGVFQFLDAAHRWVVLSFADVTSSSMQSVWERYE